MNMDSKFSQTMREILAYSREEAIRLNNSNIGTEHLFLGILREGENQAVEMLDSIGVNLMELKQNLDEKMRKNGTSKELDPDRIPLLKSAENVLKILHLEARSLKQTEVDTGHLLLAILRDETSLVTQLLIDYEVFYDTIKEMIQK